MKEGFAPGWADGFSRADLVICAARISEQLGIDLDDSVQQRTNTLIERWGGK